MARKRYTQKGLATQVRLAQELSIRLQNARVEREEREIVDSYIAEIENYLVTYAKDHK